jgi:pimeloyl-ACP methyl ester carboxylesterase
MLELISRQTHMKTRRTPLLFVHGAWHGAWCWDEYFLPYFARCGYEAHAVSLRGHGGSPGPGRLSWVSAADYAADLAATVRRLTAPPIIIGHSMGGFVVQKYLERYYAPAAILMASAPPKPIFRTTFDVIRHAPLAFLRVNLKMDLYPVVGTPKLAGDFLFSADMPVEKVADYHGRLQSESYRVYLDMLGLSLPRPELVKTPIMVLGAAKDAIFSVKEVEETAAAYHTQANIFPNMAHDMMLESGWQAVADKILEWVGTVGSGE